MTVTGRTIGEEARRGRGDAGPGGGAAARRAAQADRRPRDPARQPRARGLRGEAVRATSACEHRGPARVFECEEDAFAAVTAQDDQARRRGRDPLRGPERRPRHARDAARDRGARRRGPGRPVALLTDGRFSRRHPRLHGRPRRARGAATAARSPPCATATRSCSTSPEPRARRGALGRGDRSSASPTTTPPRPTYTNGRARPSTRQLGRLRPEGADHPLARRHGRYAACDSPVGRLLRPAGRRLARNHRAASLNAAGRSSIGTWPVSSITTLRRPGSAARTRRRPRTGTIGPSRPRRSASGTRHVRAAGRGSRSRGSARRASRKPGLPAPLMTS